MAALTEIDLTDDRPRSGAGGIVDTRRQRRARKRRRRQTAIVLALATGVIALAALVFLTFLADTWLGRNRVVRGVELDGVTVNGFDEDALTDVRNDLDTRLARMPMELVTPEGAVMTDAAGLALQLDWAATVDATLAIGRAEGVVDRFMGWVTRFWDPVAAPIKLKQTDSATMQRAVDVLQTELLWPATEPAPDLASGVLELRPGIVGQTINVVALRGDLPTAITDTSQTIATAVLFEDVPTMVDDLSMQASLDEANARTAKGITITVVDAIETVDPATLRSWFAIDAAADGPTVTALSDRVDTHLRHLFAGIAELGDDAQFEIADGEVSIGPGEYRGQRCCALGAGEDVLRAVEQGDLEIELRVRDYPSTRDVAWASSLGITEEIGSYTTLHPAGQSRVRNIHRIADLIRGQVIEPGATFSVNDFVGRRTSADGFVGAGVIYNGQFTNDIGGGISQFATTLFNAAFFAGLDFGEYQSHSIYISRYPYGREATLSYPHPDLQIVNNTPYGVMIWPSYGRSSITVTLFSTETVEVEQTDQRRSRQGACTFVTTERARRSATGRIEVDEVHALYRPGEGVNCGGPYPPSWPGMPDTLDPITTVTP